MSHFLVISPGRSASTSLRLTIDTAPAALCHGEILGKNRVLGVSEKLPDWEAATPRMRAGNPARFIRMLLETDSYAHHGFKALFSHFFLEQNDIYLDWILSRRPKIVFLWRRNLVNRYLSECRKKMLENRPDPARFARVDVAAITADAQAHIRMARDIRTRLAGHGVTTIMDIEFEDLIAGPQGMHEVMAFLGLAGDGFEIRKDPRTQHNERAPAPVPDPAAFSDPAVARYTDVSLREALREIA